MFMQSLPLIAVGFLPSCPTAHPELLSLPAALHLLGSPRSPRQLELPEDLHMNQLLLSLTTWIFLWACSIGAVGGVALSPVHPSPSPSQQISQSVIDVLLPD